MTGSWPASVAVPAGVGAVAPEDPPRANWTAGLVSIVALAVITSAVVGFVALLVWLAPKLLF